MYVYLIRSNGITLVCLWLFKKLVDNNSKQLKFELLELS